MSGLAPPPLFASDRKAGWPDNWISAPAGTAGDAGAIARRAPQGRAARAAARADGGAHAQRGDAPLRAAAPRSCAAAAEDADLQEKVCNYLQSLERLQL